MTNDNTIPLHNAASAKMQTRQRKQRIERLLLLATVALVLGAWVYGYLANGTDIVALVPEVLPGSVRIEKRGELFIGLDEKDQVLGYAAVGEAPGYAGPISVLVGIGPDGSIRGVKVAEQRESPGFFRRIVNQSFVEQYLGKLFDDPLQLDQDVDAVTGATASAEGIALSVREAVRRISANGLEQPLPAEQRSIKFGFPEIAIILLYAFGYVGHKLRSSQWKKRIRWGTLLSGMVVLGFMYTIPFTITMVVSLLSGYWPDWHNSLYWYLLIGGILFVTTIDAKNPYCSWFCPFGAFQETLAQLTKAKLYRPRDLSSLFTWLQRGLALAAVVLGLALRRPGVGGYEPFATLFDLSGTPVEWVFLGIIAFSSLIMYRPFCNFLCPLEPIYDFIGASRKLFLEVLKTWRKTSAKA